MDSDVFDGLCRALGYQPDSVLSIRVNPRKVVLVHTDATGDLRRAIRRIGDERRSTEDCGPAAASHRTDDRLIGPVDLTLTAASGSPARGAAFGFAPDPKRSGAGTCDV